MEAWGEGHDLISEEKEVRGCVIKYNQKQSKERKGSFDSWFKRTYFFITGGMEVGAPWYTESTRKQRQKNTNAARLKSQDL